MTDKWCILRVSANSTLRLAASLADAGFKVWSPAEMSTPKPKLLEPGERPLAPRKPQVPRKVAMLPSFVFAQADRLGELLALSRSPSPIYQVWDAELRRMVTKGHPFFTVWHTGDDVALVPDRELEALRQVAHRRKPRTKGKTFKPGDQVRLTDDAFAGLTGTVKRKVGKLYEVMFDGFPHAVQFGVEWLTPVLDVNHAIHHKGDQSERGNSDRDAA